MTICAETVDSSAKGNLFETNKVSQNEDSNASADENAFNLCQNQIDNKSHLNLQLQSMIFDKYPKIGEVWEYNAQETLQILQAS